MEPATASGKQQRALKEQPLQMCLVQINTNKCFLASDINRYKIIHLQVQLPFTETSKALDFFFGELQFPWEEHTGLLIRGGGKQVKPWEFVFSTK